MSLSLFNEINGVTGEEPGTHAGDNWRSLGVGFDQLGEMLTAFGSQVATRLGSEPLRLRFDQLHRRGQLAEQTDTANLSTARQRQMNAPIGGADFWNDPAGVVGAQFLTNVPIMGAAAAATIAAGLTGGAPFALAAGSIGGGVLSGGQYASAIDSVLAEKSDTELMQLPFVQERIKNGESMAQIRLDLRAEAMGHGDVLSTIGGMILGAVGPETLLSTLAVSSAARTLTKGVLGRAGGAAAGAAAGIVTEGADEAIPAYEQNLAHQRVPIIPETSVLDNALAGAVLGVVPGAFAGGLAGGGTKSSRVAGKSTSGTSDVPLNKTVVVPKGNSQVTVSQPGIPDPTLQAGLDTIKSTPAPAGAGTAPVATAGAATPAVPTGVQPEGAVPAAATQSPGVPPSPSSPVVSIQAAGTPAVATGANSQPAASQADEDYQRGRDLVFNDSRASTAYLQRKLNMPYGRAANVMDRLQKDGVISAADVAGRRSILVDVHGNRLANPVVQAVTTAADLTTPISGDIAPVTTSDVGIPDTAAVVPSTPPVEGPPAPQGAPSSDFPGGVATTPAPINVVPPESLLTPIEDAPTDAATTFSPDEAASPRVPSPEPIGFTPEGARILAAVAPDISTVDAAPVAAIKDRAKGRHDQTPEQTAKITNDAQSAEQIFQDTAPQGTETDNQLVSRINNILARAAAAEIKVPKNVTTGLSDHMMWLVNAKKALGSKPLRSMFAGGDFAARAGDFNVMRGEHGAKAIGRGVGAGGEALASVGTTTTTAVNEADAAQREQDAQQAADALAEKPQDSITEAAPEVAKTDTAQVATEGASSEDVTTTATGSRRAEPLISAMTETHKGVERQTAKPGTTRAPTAVDKAKYAAMLAEQERKSKVASLVGEHHTKPTGTVAAEAVKAKAKPKATSDVVKAPTKPAVSIQKARAETDPKTGKKGKFSVVGLRFALDVARGQRRVFGDGHVATTALTNDYGSIVGVEGADGENMDVFIGSGVKALVGSNIDAEHIFVIDQINPNNNGKFDEHKVMFGFVDAQAATEAYQQAYGDSAQSRFGGIRAMSLDEFKLWLKEGNKKAPVDETIAPTAVARNLEDITQESDVTDTGVVKSGFAEARNYNSPVVHDADAILWQDIADVHLAHTPGAENFFGHWIQPVAKMTLAGAIDTMDIAIERNADDIGYAVAGKINETLLETHPNIPVYVLKTQDLDTAAGKSPNSNPRAAAFYKPSNKERGEFIAISEDSWRQLSERVYIIAHEGIHAVTNDTLSLWTSMHKAMEDLIEHIKQHHGVTNRQHYGLHDPFELISELANPDFRKLLQNTPVSRELGARLGLQGWRKATAWNTVLDWIRRVFKLPTSNFNALEVVMSQFERISHTYSDNLRSDYSDKAFRSGAVLDSDFNAVEKNFAKIRDRTKAAREMWDRQMAAQPPAQAHELTVAAVNQAMTTRAIEAVSKAGLFNSNNWLTQLLKLQSNDAIVRGYEHKFSGNDLREYDNAVQGRSTKARTLNAKDVDLLIEQGKLFKQYEGKTIGGQSVQDHFEELIHDESNFNVDASISLKANTWLGKDSLSGIPGKAQHARLAAMHRDLARVAPDLVAHRQKLFDYFRAKQRAIINGILTNKVQAAAEALGNTLTDSQALAIGERVISNKATPADIAAIGEDAHDQISSTPEFKFQKGPYIPQMRYGQYEVRANVNVQRPASTLTYKDQSSAKQYIFDFYGKKATARRNAVTYARELNRQGIYAATESIWTDSNGNMAAKADLGSENRFRVYTEKQHVEFFETEREANDQRAALVNDPYYSSVNKVSLRPAEEQRGSTEGPSKLQAVLNSLDNRPMLKGLSPKVQREVKTGIQQAMLRVQPGTSMSKRRMQRRHVAGASRDSMRVLHSYAIQANSYLAAIEAAPDIAKAFNKLQAFVRNDSSKDSIIRQRVIDELRKREQGQGGLHENSISTLVQTATTVQFIDKMLSPAASIINATQLPMITLPVLAAKHGLFNSSRALARALSDIGFVNLVHHGASDFVQAMTGKLDKSASYTDLVKLGKVSADEARMMDALVERGPLANDAGFEATKHVLSGGAGSILNAVDTVGRQFPLAIEAINRHGAALAAYRLARNKGLGHDAAVNYAQDVVNETQFNYNPSNTSPIFNTNIGRVALQFKKFGMAYYQLMASMIVKVFKNVSPGDRAQGLKAFGYLMGANVLASGLLGGLPTEPIRAMITLLNAMGVIDFDWATVESNAREMAADIIGQTAGEALMKGLPRLLDIDVSSRIGASSLLVSQPFGDMQTKAGWINYIYSLAGGPTGSMIGEIPGGVQDLVNGNFSKAAQTLIPMKIMSDALKAASYWDRGKTTAGGDVITSYNPVEALIQLLGFTPGSSAEASSLSNAAHSEERRRQGRVSDLKNEFVDTPAADRYKFIPRLQEFNKGKSAGEVLSLSDLYSYAKSKDTRFATSVKAVPKTKGNAAILERLGNTYR